MNAITGRNAIEIGGVLRTLACDMNAATVLYEAKGEHWTMWLIERFVGRPVDLPDGGKGRKLEKLPPAELIEVLYALMATDREEAGRVDDIKVLRKSIRLGDLLDVQTAVTRAVISSFGIPGEELEVVAGAADGPRGSERAATDGTGTRP